MPKNGAIYVNSAGGALRQKRMNILRARSVALYRDVTSSDMAGDNKDSEYQKNAGFCCRVPATPLAPAKGQDSNEAVSRN